MHTKIIPHMANPLLLTDFLYKALEVGGLMGMLALHGIFTLVTKHGLEYPHFYQRLYSLLVPASLMVRPCSPQHAARAGASGRVRAWRGLAAESATCLGA